MEESVKLLGKIEGLVENNAKAVETVLEKFNSLEKKVDQLNDKINTTDTDLKVLKAKGAGILTGVAIISSLVFSFFSEKITELKHFIFN